jgi:type VI protein secretion system component Hcp
MTFRIEKKWRWLVAAGAVFVPGIVSGALSLPFTFKSGDPIRAADVNANFAALQSRLDALTLTQSATAPVGTFTVAGLGQAMPIYQFSMSVDVPVTLAAGAGQSTGKPTLSDITLVRGMDATTPSFELQLNNEKTAATADITVGNLTIHLTNVLLTQIATSGAGAPPQETIGLSYQTIEWVWPVTGGDTKTVDYDRAKAVASSAATTTSFELGYYAPGATQDKAFPAISSFAHAIQVPTVAAGAGSGNAKAQHGAFTVRAPVSAMSFDELAVALSVRTGNTVDLQVFDATGAVSNEVKLAAVVVQSFALSADATGLTNATSFNYAQIQWLANNTQTSWDVSKNTGG